MVASKRAQTPYQQFMANKKVKKDPNDEKFAEVATGFKAAGLPADVQEMLVEIIPNTLGVTQQNRHNFQDKMIDIIDKILVETEGKLKNTVDEKAKALSDTESTKALRQVTVSTATESVELKKSESLTERASLAKVALAWRAAQAALAEAQTAEAKANEAALAAERTRGELQGALELLNELQEAPDEKKKQKFMTLLKGFGFEESMLVALPAALAKEKTDRGAFDNLSLESVRGDLGKRITDKSEIISAAEPGRAAHAATVAKAKEEVKAATATQLESAKKYMAIDGECKASETALKEAKDSIKAINNTERQDKRGYTNAQAQLDLFLQGPRQSFEELRKFSEPPPEQPAEAVVEGVTEQVAA